MRVAATMQPSRAPQGQQGAFQQAWLLPRLPSAALHLLGARVMSEYSHDNNDPPGGTSYTALAPQQRHHERLTPHAQPQPVCCHRAENLAIASRVPCARRHSRGKFTHRSAAPRQRQPQGGVAHSHRAFAQHRGLPCFSPRVVQKGTSVWFASVGSRSQTVRERSPSKNLIALITSTNLTKIGPGWKPREENPTLM